MRNNIILRSLVLISLLLTGCQQSGSLPTTGDNQFGMGWFDRAMIPLSSSLRKIHLSLGFPIR
jgi:hypothetical protein